MLVSNHSGGIPTDGFMLSAADVLELEPPRVVHSMVDKFMKKFPSLSSLMRELGQIIGLPSNVFSVLDVDRVLLVFPESAKGTCKAYRDRYKLIRFGTGL